MISQKEMRHYNIGEVAERILSSPDEAYQATVEAENTDSEELMMDIYDSILDGRGLVESGERPRRGTIYLASSALFTTTGVGRFLGPEALEPHNIGGGTGSIIGGLYLGKKGVDDVLDVYSEEDREKSFEMLADLTVHPKEDEDVYRVEYDPNEL